MRSFVACCGLFAIVGAPLDSLQAQTDLFRFPPSQGVPVAPAPAVVPFAMTPNVAVPAVAPTTSFRVPVAAPVFVAPAAQAPSFQAVDTFQDSTTAFYGSADPAPVVDSFRPVMPAEFATEWTPVESAPIAASPNFSTQETVVTEYPPTTTTYRVSPTPPQQVVWSSDWAATSSAGITPDSATLTFPPTVTYSAFAAANTAAPISAPATVSVNSATAIPVGPPVTVRPNGFIQGQPIRNMFRAITP